MVVREHRQKTFRVGYLTNNSLSMTKVFCRSSLMLMSYSRVVGVVFVLSRVGPVLRSRNGIE